MANYMNAYMGSGPSNPKLGGTWKGNTDDEGFSLAQALDEWAKGNVKNQAKGYEGPLYSNYVDEQGNFDKQQYTLDYLAGLMDAGQASGLDNWTPFGPGSTIRGFGGDHAAITEYLKSLMGYQTQQSIDPATGQATSTQTPTFTRNYDPLATEYAVLAPDRLAWQGTRGDTVPIDQEAQEAFVGQTGTAEGMSSQGYGDSILQQIIKMMLMYQVGGTLPSYPANK